MAQPEEQMRSPFGQKPSSLPNPVPGTEAEQNVAQGQASSADELSGLDLSLLTVPSEDAATVEGTTGEGAALPPETQDDAFSQLQQIPEQAGDVLSNIRQSFNQSIIRAKSSFATNPAEKIRFLEKVYGSENVTVNQDGAIQFRRSREMPFEPFDPGKEALVTDAFNDALDFSREAAEASIEGLFRLGGAAGGAALGGTVGATKGAATGAIAGPVGSTAGAITEGGLGALGGGAAGAAAVGGLGAGVAYEMGNRIQEQIGIEIDPQRNTGMESAAAVGLGAGFNFLSARIARTKAYNDSIRKITGENIQSASQKLDDAAEAVRTVEESGILKDGTKIRYTPAQVAGSNLPELEAVEDVLSKDERFRDFMTVQGNTIQEAYNGVIRTLTNAKGIPSDLADRIGAKITDMKALEGATIGTYRKKALEATKGAKQPIRNVIANADDTFERLGLDPQSFLSANPAQRIEMIENTGLTRSQSKILGSHLSRLASAAEEGMPLKEIDDLYRTMRGQIDNTINSSTNRPLAQKLIPLKNALEADRLDAIGRELPEGSRDLYQQAKGRYSEIVSGMRTLNKSLLENNISREAFARKVFASNDVKNMRAMKQIIQKQEPQLWNEMAADYFDVLRRKHTNAQDVVNWNSVAKEYKNIPDEAKKELFGGTQLAKESMDALIKVASLPPKKFKVRQGNNTSIKDTAKDIYFMLANTLPGTKAAAAGRIISSIGGKEQALAKYLNAGGIDDVLKFVPKNQKTSWKEKLMNAVEWSLNTTRKAATSAPASTAVRASEIEGRQTNQRQREE